MRTTAPRLSLPRYRAQESTRSSLASFHCSPWEARLSSSASGSHSPSSRYYSTQSTAPSTQPGTKVIVGMSGGVDSSVAAWKLKKEGYDVTGVFMKNWEPLDEDRATVACESADDFDMVKKLGKQIDVPVYETSFVKEYWNDVFSPSLDAMREGLTPNPDVLCNRQIKFDSFLSFALNQGAECIATGHYARIRRSGDGHELLRAKDKNKDQTYFLSTIKQHALTKTLFPLGDMTKDEVRRVAKDLGFVSADKPSSKGICFVGKRRKFSDFLKEYITAEPGRIINLLDKAVLGQHQGLVYYTLGQSPKTGGMDCKLGVVKRDFSSNTLYVAPINHPSMFSTSFTATVHWISGSSPFASSLLLGECQTRYRQESIPCMIAKDSESTAIPRSVTSSASASSPLDGEKIRVETMLPVRAVAPGQIFVFYQQDRVLGGGPITSVGESLWERGITELPQDHII